MNCVHVTITAYGKQAAHYFTTPECAKAFAELHDGIVDNIATGCMGKNADGQIVFIPENGNGYVRLCR